MCVFSILWGPERTQLLQHLAFVNPGFLRAAVGFLPSESPVKQLQKIKPSSGRLPQRGLHLSCHLSKLFHHLCKVYFSRLFPHFNKVCIFCDIYVCPCLKFLNTAFPYFLRMHGSSCIVNVLCRSGCLCIYLALHRFCLLLLQYLFWTLKC